MKDTKILGNERLRALIFDLDNIIAESQTLQVLAWKRLFDHYNHQRKLSQKPEYVPFDREVDYSNKIHGHSIYDAVRTFLSSRNIKLPEGDPDDLPGYESVSALGNMKNQIYRDLFKDRGIDFFSDLIEPVERWKDEGYKTAAISTNKKCHILLKDAGIDMIFDKIVDGYDIEKLDLKGKPEADIYLEAARQLNVSPEETAVFEDDVEGIKAARKGGFKRVVGLSRNNSPETLRNYGANIVIRSYATLNHTVHEFDELPSALTRLGELFEDWKNKELLFFLDYDMLHPAIRKQPEDIFISEEIKDLLSRLSNYAKVTVINGRDLSDIRQMTGLDQIYYAGNYGFEISGPGNIHYEHEGLRKILPKLDIAEKLLRDKLLEFDNVRFERQRYVLSIHYQNLEDEKTPEAESRINQILLNRPDLEKVIGEKMIEIRPYQNWNKGKAMKWLMGEVSGILHDNYLVYLGNDFTDEDAFTQIIKQKGIRILVGNHGELTLADYKLQDLDEVKAWLNNIIEKMKIERKVETRM